MAENETFGDLQISVELVNKEEVILLIPLIISLLLISTIGLPGNGLVCYFYGVKSTMSTSSKWFIFFLGCANLVQCAIVVPGEMITTFFQYNFTNSGACKTITFFNCSSLAVLVYTLAIVAIDRYRKVCKPHGWQIKFRTAKILSAAAVVIALLISFPLFWVYGIKSYELAGYNITVRSCGFSEEASNSPLTFYYVLFGMIFTTVSLTTMCILYCCIGRGIRQRLYKEQNRRQQSTRANNHDIRAPFSRRKIVEVISLRTLTKKPSKTDSYDSKSKHSDRKHKTCIGEEESTTSATSCNDDAFAYYVQSTSHFQQSKPMVRKKLHVRKTTFSLFLISLAFVLSYLPTLLLLLIRSINSDFEAGLTDTERAIYKFFLRTCFWNCAMNPFLLALSDSRYRTCCKDSVCQFWKCLTCKK